MHIAICQHPGVLGNVAANLRIIDAQAGKAAGRGAAVVVFPELFLTGYNLGDRVLALAEPVDGPSLRALAAIAETHRIAVVCGYAERSGTAVYNGAVLIDDAGITRLNHRKLHLWAETEQRLFSPGSTLAVAQLGDLTVGLLICYDVEFPEVARSLALQGADLILVPTALPARFHRLPHVVIPARAFENQVYMAYANRCGEEAGLAYLGSSTIAGPDATVLAQAGTDPALLIAKIDPAAHAASRAENPYLTDRRPALYHPG